MPTTVQNILDTIYATIPGAPLAETVDTLKSGSADQPVTGIVSTFMATYPVIERAVALGANFIITHEPTYYSHLDETDWLADDPVYQAKRALLDDNGIAVWRFHDHWHRHQPDGIITGVLRQLGWEAYADTEHRGLCTIPPTSLSDLVAHLKKRLGADLARVVGDPDLVCRRVGLSVGAAGWRYQHMALVRGKLDVLMCGEVNEWETPEYVRDALAQGRKLGLIVLGHANSEEAGMAYLAEWLAPKVPGIPITHVPAGDPFRLI